MRWLALVGILSGCLSSGSPLPPPVITQVRRAMLAPLPPAPLVAFDDQPDSSGAGPDRHHLEVSAQLHPFEVTPGPTSSGVGVPVYEVAGGGMMKVSKSLAVGGALQLVPAYGAKFRHPESQLAAPSHDAFGALLAAQLSPFTNERFGCDLAAQLSFHDVPVAVVEASGPLRSTGSRVSARREGIAGFALTLLPHVVTPYGTIFGGLQGHTNANIDATGVRITQGGEVLDSGAGSVGILFAGQLGVGYSLNVRGVAFSASLWVPLATDIGYTPTFALSLGGRLGSGPVSAPKRESNPPMSVPPPLPAPLPPNDPARPSPPPLPEPSR